MKRRTTIGVSGNGNNGAIGGIETDHHSGFHTIEEDSQVVVKENKQMTVTGMFIQHGFLIQNGEIIMK